MSAYVSKAEERRAAHLANRKREQLAKEGTVETTEPETASEPPSSEPTAISRPLSDPTVVRSTGSTV
jgi:hypothetical protein